MQRNVTISNEPIVCFNRDVFASELELFDDFHGDIVINGDLFLDLEKISMDYNLSVINIVMNTGLVYDINSAKSIYCNGLLQAGHIAITGNLFCRGLEAIKTEVDGDLICLGDLKTWGIKVSGALLCEGTITGEFHPSIEVKGNLTCKGSIFASRIQVDGNLSCEGTITGKYNPSIEVKGSLVCKGSILASIIKVDGDLSCTGTISSGTMTEDFRCYPYIAVKGNLICLENMETSRIKVSGELTCKGHINSHDYFVDVKGTINYNGWLNFRDDATLCFNRNVLVSELEVLFKEKFRGTIVINGDLILEKDFDNDYIYPITLKVSNDIYSWPPAEYYNINVDSITCNKIYRVHNIDCKTLYCNYLKVLNSVTAGSLTCKGDIKGEEALTVLNIRSGDLVCEGNISVHAIKVRHDIYCKGNMYSARNIEAGGNIYGNNVAAGRDIKATILQSEGDIYANSCIDTQKGVRCRGDLEAQYLRAPGLDYGGSLILNGVEVPYTQDFLHLRCCPDPDDLRFHQSPEGDWYTGNLPKGAGGFASLEWFFGEED